MTDRLPGAATITAAAHAVDLHASPECIRVLWIGVQRGDARPVDARALLHDGGVRLGPAVAGVVGAEPLPWPSVSLPQEGLVSRWHGSCAMLSQPGGSVASSITSTGKPSLMLNFTAHWVQTRWSCSSASRVRPGFIGQRRISSNCGLSIW